MKRGDLIKRIGKAAAKKGVTWKLAYHGANHDMYLLGDKKIPIGRHTELDNRYAETIYRQCEELLGERWWRK